MFLKHNSDCFIYLVRDGIAMDKHKIGVMQLYTGAILLVLSIVVGIFLYKFGFQQTLVQGVLASTQSWSEANRQVNYTDNQGLANVVSDTTIMGSIYKDSISLFILDEMILISISLLFIFRGFENMNS